MNLDEFLRRNGVDVDGFIEEYARKLIGVYERYDDGIARFAIYGDYEDDLVDIKDVIGIPDYLAREPGFLDNFVLLFDPHGDNYHSRANGMMKYSSDEVVEKLERSFVVEPIKLYNMNGKYFLSANGNHRIHLLMLHYLMDTYKGVEIGDKYKIPVQSEKLDLVKTYSNYIGSLLWDEKFSIYSDLDENYKKTGKAQVIYHGEELILDDSELIAFVQEKLEALKNLDDYYYIDVIQSMWVKYRREETGLFKGFVDTYFPQLTDVLKAENYMELESAIKETLLGGKNYGNN